MTHSSPNTLTVNGQVYTIAQTFTSGNSASVYKTTDNHVIKVYPTDKGFNNDLLWLQTLASEDIVPTVIDSSVAERMIVMAYAGTPISLTNCPETWKEQLKAILAILKKHDCAHHDLSEHEVLVLDGKIRIIDFEFATKASLDLSDQLKKNRIFEDKFIINRLSLLLEPHQPQSEPHCFVLWDQSERKAVEQAIAEKFTIIQAITYHPKSLTLLGKNRIEVLNRFYHGRTSFHGQKGKTPFTVFVVLDTNPQYDVRANSFNHTKNIVNTNTFDLLYTLRKGRKSFLHGSDCIQESHDNLEVLSHYKHAIPRNYWDEWRPSFASIKDFFETLNNTPGLTYTVLRGQEEIADLASTEQYRGDIDILVNDFFLCKRIVGGIAYKHTYSKLHPHYGVPKEYGGYKVANKVMIGGKQVSVDIRFVGDGYYDEKWEQAMLDTRKKTGNMYVLEDTHSFYAVLYHALVHKKKFPKKYQYLLDSKALSGARTDEELFQVLSTYLQSQGYDYVRPDELTIPFRVPKDRRAAENNELTDHIATLLKNEQLIDARHLLSDVVRFNPWAIGARFQLGMVLIRICLVEQLLFSMASFLLIFKKKLQKFYRIFRMK